MRQLSVVPLRKYRDRRLVDWQRLVGKLYPITHTLLWTYTLNSRFIKHVCHKYNTYGNCTEHNMTMAPCIFGIFGCLKKSCLKTFSLIKEQTVQITLWPFMLQENCIMSISFPKKFAHLEICALIRHRPTDYHSLGVQTFQSVCLSVCMMPTAADSCPNMAAPLWRETRSLASHSSSNTDTGTQAEGGNSLCVCVRDQSSSSVCACLSPWAGGEGWEDRWRSGQRDLISSPLGGIQVFADPMKSRGN